MEDQQPNPTNDPTSPVVPASTFGPINESQPVISPIDVPPQDAPTMVPSPSPAVGPDTSLQALKSVHTVGTWAIVLGILNIVLTPLLTATTYSQQTANGLGEAALVMGGLIVGLVIGAVFIGLGIKLKRTVADKIRQADKVLLSLAAAVVLIIVMNLAAGGGGAGLINILVLIVIGQARVKIKKLGTE